MRTIAIPLYPHALSSSVGLPAEMLNAAAQMLTATNRRATFPQLRLIAETAGCVTLSGGIPVHASYSVDTAGTPDLVIVPALWRNPIRTVTDNPWLTHWLAQLSTVSTRICAVGPASCFLAEAGLLRDRPATTHWFFFDTFRRHYPDVLLQRQHLITQAGNVYCAGSVNSLADLIIHFIADAFGQAIANRVEGQFSPEIRQPYDQHLYSLEGHRSHGDEDVLQIQQWLQDHYSRAITMQALARQAGMSLRTFNRRFRRATGQTPQAYLQRLRIGTARELLRNSNYTVVEIALQVGYQHAGHFTRLFRQHTGTTPQHYRQQVRGKLFNA